jgi:hypothetical protein
MPYIYKFFVLHWFTELQNLKKVTTNFEFYKAQSAEFLDLLKVGVKQWVCVADLWPPSSVKV